VPSTIEGRSLVPLLAGKRPAWRHAFLIEYYSDKVFPRVLQMGYKAVRTGRWKYIHYLELEGMDELYDLKTDPYELKNLIHQPGAAKALAAMKQEMERLLKETAAKPKSAMAEKIIGAWKLISLETMRPNGEISYDWMGRQPTGLIVYAATGQMSVQIRRDPRPAFALNDKEKATPFAFTGG
jgi:hypothetical protein